MNSNLIVLATSFTFMMVSATATSAETFRTSGDQVVITGLQPQQTYSIQVTDNNGQEGVGYIRTDACGYGIVGGAANYQRVTINNQTVRPFNLPTKSYPYCNPRSNSTGTNPQQPSNR